MSEESQTPPTSEGFDALAPEPAPQPEPEGVTPEWAPMAKRYKIKTEIVMQKTLGMPEAERTLILWGHRYAFDNDIPAGQLLKKPDGSYYSRDSVYQLFTGRRGTSSEQMLTALLELKKIEEQRASLEAARGKLSAERDKAKRASFIPTILTEKIFKVCDAARIYQRIMPIYGASQIGKTAALTEYQRQNNHGQTIYCRMPTGGAYRNFLIALAAKVRVSEHLSSPEMARQIRNAFDDSMLLIVDQAHECVQNERSQRVPMALLFCMEIFDLAGCGVVIVGTDVLSKSIEGGPFAKNLRQLRLRCLGRGLKLPDKPTKRNLADFAAWYDLAPAEGRALELQTEIIDSHGLGYWLTILQAANRFSAKKGADMEWKHVIAAKSMLDALSLPMGEEDEE